MKSVVQVVAYTDDMEQKFALDHDRSGLSRRSALKSGAALAGAGVATLVLPAAANAASFGAAPTGQAALGGVPTAIGSVNESGITLNISWKTTGNVDVAFSYVWYYNDTTPRSMGGSGTATGYLAIYMGPTVEGLSTDRWAQSEGAGPGKTISFYIVDSAGVRYKFENKYSTDQLTFISY